MEWFFVFSLISVLCFIIIHDHYRKLAKKEKVEAKKAAEEVKKEKYSEINIEYYENGSIKSREYLVNSKRHRKDGPAGINYYKDGSVEYEAYWINDKWHRIDGSASIEYHKNGSIKFESYWIKGKHYTKHDFLNSDEHNRWLMEQEILKELT